MYLMNKGKLMITEKSIRNWIIVIPIIGVILSSVLLTELFIYEIKQVNDFEEKQLLIDAENNIKYIVKTRIDNVVNLLEKSYKQKLQQQRNEIKNTVDIAHNIIESIYTNYKHLGNDVVIEKINNKLRPLKFYENQSGYYFIFTLDGKSVLAPHAQHLEGLDFFNLENKPYAREFISNFLQLVNSKNEGFQNWNWYKPNETVAKEKLGYIKVFKPLNILVGSGMYLEDIEFLIKRKLQELLNIITYENNEYIFAYDKNGITISHIEKSLLGANRWDFLINGRNTVQEIIKEASLNKAGTFLRYTATIDPNTNNSADKISYIKEFPLTQWVIGTGMYTNSILESISKKQKKIKQKLEYTIQKVIVLSFIVTTILILIMIYLSNKVGNYFTAYKNRLNSINESLEEKVKERTKELKKSRDKLKKLALLDPLTGLYNRRYFESVIDKLLQVSKRKDEPLCLVIIDIDNFKTINDNYGHDVGDDVIKSLADILLSQLRKSDITTRIGGEEFAVVFPNTSLNDTEKLTNKIRKVIENLEIKIDVRNKISFTVSIGVSIYNNDIDSCVKTILKRADEALYKAKNSGKNKVVVYEKGEI